MSTSSVRPPVCADDRWYPSDPEDLQQLLDQLLANVPAQPLEGELIGLIAPHAGYAFSGQTAAYAYAQLSGRPFERVVVIGPSHFQDLGAEAVNSSDLYQTPLGEIAVDAEAVNEINHRLGIQFVPRDREHSLEMQLPFLQRQLGAFTLLPIMMSHPFYIYGLPARNDCENLSAALAQVMDEQTLLVASSDLSHLHDYDAVTYFDQGTENLIGEYDIGGLVDWMVNEGECRACGDVAIITLLMAARARGANRVRVLYRTNSGDVSGIKEPGQYTVGYMAAAIYRAKE
jgi:MEMO1 family protein